MRLLPATSLLLGCLNAQTAETLQTELSKSTGTPQITIINQPPVITNIVIIQQPNPTCRVNHTTCPDFSCCPTFNACCAGVCCGNGSICLEQSCIVPLASPLPIANESSISSTSLVLAVLIPAIIILIIGIIFLLYRSKRSRREQYALQKKPAVVVVPPDSVPLGIGKSRVRSILSPIAPTSSVFAEVSNHLAYSNASLVSLSSLSVSPQFLHNFAEDERIIGNSTMLFYETTRNCNIGVTNSKLPCSDPLCGICKILATGFEKTDGNGIRFSSMLSADFPASSNSILLVCNVALGNTLYSSSEQLRRHSYADSYSLSETKQEYTIYNPSQAIPLYLCEIRRDNVT